MKIEFFPPDSVTELRHWVRLDQAFAMMLGTGSIEWGSKRSLLEKFDHAPGHQCFEGTTSPAGDAFLFVLKAQPRRHL